MLWDVEHPQLYTARITYGEQRIEKRFGLRTFEFKEHGPFYLNGKRLLLNGTHRHEDHAGVGAAMTDSMIRRELQQIKDMGANFIRLGHYQQSDLVLQLCDSLGILVWEEIPWCRGGVGGERYQQQAQKAPIPFLYKALKIMNQCDQGYRQSSNKRLLVEITLIQVAQITQPDDADASAGRSPKRLKSLFRKLLNNAQQPKASRQGAAVERRQTEREAAKADAPKKYVTPQQNSSTASNVADHVALLSTTASPATAAPVASVISPTAAPNLKLDELGITFQRLRKGEKKKAAEADVEITNKEEKKVFSEEDLQNAWIAMCNRMPQKMVAMAQRMKNMQPTLIGEDHIEVVVDNDFLLNEMGGIKGRIRATLAKDLHNGQIQISLRKAEAEEVKTDVISLKTWWHTSTRTR